MDFQDNQGMQRSHLLKKQLKNVSGVSFCLYYDAYFNFRLCTFILKWYWGLNQELCIPQASTLPAALSSALQCILLMNLCEILLEEQEKIENYYFFPETNIHKCFGVALKLRSKTIRSQGKILLYLYLKQTFLQSSELWLQLSIKKQKFEEFTYTVKN